MTKILTTTIGSFPRQPFPTPEESIKAVVDVQVRLGIDIISDGEQRHDIIGYFLGFIPGLGCVGGRPCVLGRIEPPARPSEFVKVRDYLYVVDYLTSIGKRREVKATITGPVTLGFTCAANKAGPYKGVADPSLYRDLAIALETLAHELASNGALVQLDEPGLSPGFVNPAIAIPSIELATSRLDPSRTSIHICGRIRRALYEHLLSAKGIGVLSLAFSSEPENIQVISGIKPADYAKKLGVGCARVNIPPSGKPDSEQEIERTARRVCGLVGPGSVGYVHPDCGLRDTPMGPALKTLENLVAAASTLATRTPSR